MAGGRGVELGPVQLLLQAMKGFVADPALGAHAIERLPLGANRPQPEPVVVRRRLRLARVLGHVARRRVLLAHGRRGRRLVAVEAVERRLHDGDPRLGNLPLDGAVVGQLQPPQQRLEGEPLDDERAENDAEGAQHDQVACGKCSGSANAVASVTRPRMPVHDIKTAPRKFDDDEQLTKLGAEPALDQQQKIR